MIQQFYRSMRDVLLSADIEDPVVVEEHKKAVKELMWFTSLNELVKVR